MSQPPWAAGGRHGWVRPPTPTPLFSVVLRSADSWVAEPGMQGCRREGGSGPGEIGRAAVPDPPALTLKNNPAHSHGSPAVRWAPYPPGCSGLRLHPSQCALSLGHRPHLCGQCRPQPGVCPGSSGGESVQAHPRSPGLSWSSLGQSPVT